MLKSPMRRLLDPRSPASPGGLSQLQGSLMYLKQHTKVPDAPGRITFKKKGGSTYVLYETGRVYNAERQFNVPKRAIIGKLVDPSDRTLMLPNENYLKLFPEAPQDPPEEPPSWRSSTVHVGAFIALSAVIRECRLRGLLEASFGADAAGVILDLAVCRIVTEENAAAVWPDYAWCHPLFTGNMRMLNEDALPEFLSRLLDVTIAGFLDDCSRARDHRERLWISCDLTNGLAMAGELELAESVSVLNRQNVLSLSPALASDSAGQPLFYKILPRTVPGLGRLRYLIDRIEEHGCHSAGVVLYRGSVSRDTIEYLDQKDIPFLLMMQGHRESVSSLIEANRGTFETKRATRIGTAGVHGVTVRGKLFPGESEERSFHLFFDPSQTAAERAEFNRLLDRMAELLRRHEGIDLMFAEPWTRWFTCRYAEENGRKRFLSAEEKQDAIQRELELCGYSCIVSSEAMTAAEAWSLCRGHDAFRGFLRDVSWDSLDSLPGYSAVLPETLIFIDFIALILQSRFRSLLEKQVQDPKARRRALTVPEAVRELERIEMTRQDENRWLPGGAMTKTQQEILRALGLSPEDAFSEMQRLAAALR